MSPRVRTAWLEIASGFHLLFAASAASALTEGARPFGAPLMLLAACAVFLLHPFRSSRFLRACLFLFAGLAASAGAVWFGRAGDFTLAALQAGYALWLAAAAFVPWCDRRIIAIDEKPVAGHTLLYGAVLAAIGVHALVVGGADAWHATLPAAASVVAGGALLWVELRGVSRARLAATVLAATGFLYWGVAAMAGGRPGAGSASVAVLALLLLSVAVGDRAPEAADDLAGTTPRQRDLYAHARTEEAVVWTIAAVSAAALPFGAPVDARLYAAAIFSFAIATLVGYRLRPAASISDRGALMTLAAFAASSLVLIAATGGALGPFIPLAYLAIFTGAAVTRPRWSIAIAVLYASYVTAEFVWSLGRPSDAPAPAYLFLAATLLLAGVYAAWAGRRRAATDEALLAANRRLAEALRNAVRERERYERQALDLKGLNENLLEMRSALMNVLEDVEDSKRQIEAERRREVASFNALAEGVVAAGKDGHIFLCNPTAARILGVPAESVVGQPIESVLRLFHEEGVVMQTRAFEEAYTGRTVALGERLRLARKDGSHVPVSGNVAPYLDEENRTTGVVAAFRDVTVEREIDRQKSDFISIASHQLRTPLSALRWFLDLLLAGDAGPLKAAQKEYLSDMSVSVTRMVKLVGDLLNISRIESGRTKPNPERIETRTFVDALVREFAPLVRQQEVAFTSSVAKDASTFFADPNLAQQAVANVLSNAVKYTPPGGTVALEVKVQGGETVFKVRDTGLGIPKAQQYRIFDKFFRGENVVAQETVGSGLGLYVVKTVVDLSGGRIWFESEEKKGTTFFLAFPNGPQALPVGAAGGTLSA